MSQVSGGLVRWRYAVLALWCVPWLVLATVRRPRGYDDWLWFELGGRIIAHHLAPPMAGPALHLYANYAAIQVGPPALVLVAGLQWLPPHVVATIADIVMAGAGLVGLRAAERVAVAQGVATTGRLTRRVLVAGLVALPFWVWQCVMWRHLDDVLAVVLVLMAAPLVARGRREVLAGLLVGIGVAAKPWAVVLVPLLLGYARPQRPRAVLAVLVGAGACWLPFVLADPQTVHSLGSFGLPLTHGTTWRLLGISGRAPAGIRILQLGGGAALAAFTARRAGWTAVPLVALAWRVTTDPYSWPYYVLGPLMAAVLWDLARPRLGRLGSRRLAALPLATLSVIVVEAVVPRLAPSFEAPLRLLWFAGLLVVVLRQRAQVPAPASAPSERALSPAPA